MDAPPPFTPADRNFIRKMNHDYASISEDVTLQFSRAFASMSGRLQMAFRQMTEGFRNLARETYRLRGQLLAYERDTRGGNGSDAYSPLWQSAVCSAWLHSSCPDTDGALQCSCACHN